MSLVPPPHHTAISAAIIVACFLPSYANGQQIEDEIIVEGLRLPATLSESGTSVSIITSDEIEQRGYAFAVDALANAAGVTVNQNGSFGGLATVRIRGASSDQTLVLLDGVPIGDPTAVGGGYDFSIFDAAEIERIEILKGPQSTLWGSDAIGGVVNIISKRPDRGFSGRLFAEGGSFDTARGGISTSGAGDLGDLRLSISGITSDGISKADEDNGNPERDRYEGLTFAGRGGINLPAGIRLEANARHNSGRTDIDGFAPPNFALGDTNDTSQTEQFTGAVTLKAPLFNDKVQNLAMVGYTDIVRTGNFGGFRARDEGDRLIFRYQATITPVENHRIAVGAEHEENNANNQDTSITGLFGLYEVQPIERLTISAGVRYDDHSKFGDETTAKAAISWRALDNLTVRGSWGEGFKAPTIFQLTQSFGALPANDQLQPETSEAFDVGFDFSPIAQANLSVTYFNRDTENLIIFAPSFRYENLEATKAQGFEVSADFALTPSISIAADYAYIDAEDATTGDRQIRIPRHSGDIVLSYDDAGPINASAIVRYNGAETEGQFGTDVDAWVRVDLAGSYELSPSLELYGRIENLFDEDYQQISGFGTPGLSGYAGVRLSF